MSKLLALLAVIAFAFAFGLVPAGAVTKNYVDDFEHPFVGLVVFYDEEGEFSHRCSGSLLTPTVFLTAGHCTDGVSSARVYFQQDAGARFDGEIDPVTGYPEFCAKGTLGTLCATSDELYNYGFDDFADFPDIKDAGLVILDQSIELPEYGSLAAAGTLDELHEQRGQNDIIFTVSGYGLSYSSPVAVESFRSRLMAESKLVNVNGGLNQGFNLQTNGNGDDRGGTCSGDSGGPVFYPADTNVIVGVTSFGLNPYCRGTDFAFRTDTEPVLAWILDTMPAREVDNIQIVG